MLTSYNGWTASQNANDFGGISPLVIDGRSFAPGVRNGDVHDLFTHLALWWDGNVEDLNLGSPQADEWGYNFRLNRNANNLSCHSSGTAIDINATLHPNGKRGTLNAKAGLIRTQYKTTYRGLVRWGGDFTGTADEMHTEVIGTPNQIAALVAELKGAPKAGANLPAPSDAPQPWLMLPPVRSRPLSFQKWFNGYGFRPALLPIISPTSNNFGPQSEAALMKVQRRYGLTADGLDGPLTKKCLWDLGWRG
jgi:peptidoglycan hydrolase-like protein with peptidoglycan-binding domain